MKVLVEDAARNWLSEGGRTYIANLLSMRCSPRTLWAVASVLVQENAVTPGVIVADAEPARPWVVIDLDDQDRAWTSDWYPVAQWADVIAAVGDKMVVVLDGSWRVEGGARGGLPGDRKPADLNC